MNRVGIGVAEARNPAQPLNFRGRIEGEELREGVWPLK